MKLYANQHAIKQCFQPTGSLMTIDASDDEKIVPLRHVDGYDFPQRWSEHESHAVLHTLRGICDKVSNRNFAAVIISLTGFLTRVFTRSLNLSVVKRGTW